METRKFLLENLCAYKETTRIDALQYNHATVLKVVGILLYVPTDT